VSTYHVCLNHGGVAASAREFDALTVDPARLKGARPELVHGFRQAMLLNGVDSMRESGFLSSAHTSLDVEQTIEAFDRSLTALTADRLLG
jgi:glutamate-1-semialdehyde aminotransferase